LEEELSSLRARLASIETAVTKGEEGFRQDLDEQGRDLDRRAAQLEQSQGTLEALLRAESEALQAKLSATEEDLHRHSADVNATFDRDRSFVDALRAAQERFAAEAETTLAGLQEQAEGTAKIVHAASAQPYMSDDRFAPRTHPLLGSVAGFTADTESPENGGYRGFEDLFRGPEEMIRERQGAYLELVTGFAPVLDAGCGRGEFLDLLKEKGVEHRGIDLDPEMVARCREKGHDVVEEGDLLELLESLDADALGAVFSAQVIEHLDPSQLQRLLELSLARLRPGGLFIAETVNPHSAAALKAFWVDPSHRQPLFPETMLALCQLAGFAAADVFCPLGSGDWEADRLSRGEYAIVAVAPERGA